MAIQGCAAEALKPWFERLALMPSTVIRRFDYSPDAEELTVEFVTGRHYVYSNVPIEEAEALRGAFAKGVHFNRRIRDRYPYREQSES